MELSIHLLDTWLMSWVVDEEGLEKLRFLFSDTLLLAALDLVDRENGEPPGIHIRIRRVHEAYPVIKYKTPWGGIQYEVYGSTANYTVFPGLPGLSPDAPAAHYCTCPAFAYSVLLSQNQIMVIVFPPFPTPLTGMLIFLQCKHLLATMVAEKLSKCVERKIQANDLAALTVRQHTK